jgi:hypothetical protein
MTIGHEVAGVVSAVGEGVPGLAASLPVSGLVSVPTTKAPSAANRRAAARSMPPPVPEIQGHLAGQTSGHFLLLGG